MDGSSEGTQRHKKRKDDNSNWTIDSLDAIRDLKNQVATNYFIPPETSLGAAWK